MTEDTAALVESTSELVCDICGKTCRDLRGLTAHRRLLHHVNVDGTPFVAKAPTETPTETPAVAPAVALKTAVEPKKRGRPRLDTTSLPLPVKTGKRPVGKPKKHATIAVVKPVAKRHYRRTKAEMARSVAKTAAVPTTSASTMNYCIQCGSKLIIGALYCQNCGTKVPRM